MAIDSAEKRRSAAGCPFHIFLGVTPTSSTDAEWRQQAAWGYSGIAAGEPAAPEVETGGGFAPPADDRKRIRKLAQERRELRRMILDLANPAEAEPGRLPPAPKTESGLTVSEERQIERARVVRETETMRARLELVQAQILAVEAEQKARERIEEDEIVKLLVSII